ncbi:MAG: hypothetical protein ACRENJ_12405 [Candidatus Eiseniibacteriota bacterium]
MTAARPRTARPRLAAVATLLALTATLALHGAGAHAQAIRPWVPPSADSLQQWASEAKVRFQANQGDSVGGPNFRAYELVGLMGRRLVRSLGKSGLAQAHAVGVVIDSLGLDVDVCGDPRFPDFVLLMVRNPWRLTAAAVGFLYWYRGDDLRMQGAVYFGGLRPTMRVWWTGYSDQPYSLGVVDHERSRAGRIRLTLFRMNAAGSAFTLLQAPDQGPYLTGPGEAAWVDLNADDRPELVAWVRVQNDTLFESCPSCPYIIQEHTYTEARRGMWLNDVRLVPTPYATFTLFVRHLADGHRNAAARLLRDPSRVDEAVAAGWGLRARAKAWKLEYAEEERWPRWLAFLHHGPRGDQRYIVHFELKEGRWIIRDWLKPRPAGRAATPADSGAASGRGGNPAGTRRPAPAPPKPRPSGSPP